MVRSPANPWTRRALLSTALAIPAFTVGCASAAGLPATRSAAMPSGATPSPLGDRRVGIAYSLWHKDDRWRDSPNGTWGTPELGFYRSDDSTILSRHAAWLSGVGVDFVIIDWSNDLGMDVRRTGGPGVQRSIESATEAMFDTWTALSASPSAVLMIGNPGDKDAVANGKLSAKADEVHDLFITNPSRARLLESYLGKPLLLVYVGTPSPWANGLPPWRDDRFTVRFVTGFVTEQRTLVGPGGLSRYRYWSWEDRRRPTYSVFDGHPECMTVVAAWRGAGSPGREGGQTYMRQWEYARKIGPRFVLAGTFNEWWTSEQANAEMSKDIEPSREHGWHYMNILKRQATLFKEEK